MPGIEGKVVRIGKFQLEVQNVECHQPTHGQMLTIICKEVMIRGELVNLCISHQLIKIRLEMPQITLGSVEGHLSHTYDLKKG